MADVVVDSNVLVASFLESDAFHQRSEDYVNALERGDYIFHLPMLVIVEVMSAISRRAQINRQAILARAGKSLRDWERDGKLVLYPLDRVSMDNATNIALRDRLKGPDSVIAALSEELDISLKTFDMEIVNRFQRASV